MDPIKVQGVANWPTPTCKREVQAFLGFANFYRHFIKDFGKIAQPLTKLTGNQSWEWGNDQQKAVDGIKKAMTSAPILRIPNNNGKFRIETDASDTAVGAVLSQYQDDKWYPI